MGLMVRHARDFGAVNTVLGYDAVGEIVELGPGVEGFKVGQKVVTFVRIGPSILPPHFLTPFLAFFLSS